MPRILLATRTFEAWLGAWAAIGALFGGWSCVLAKGLNALCRRKRDPAWQVEQSLKKSSGQRRSRREVALFALMRRTRLGTWSDDDFRIERWSAYGSLAGSTFGVIMMALHR